MLCLDEVSLARLSVMVIPLSVFVFTCDGEGCLQTNYAMLPDYSGYTYNHIDFLISVLDNGTVTKCALICEETYQCVMFFYNTESRSCSLHNRTLSDGELTPDASSGCFSADDVGSSWIVDIVDVSSSHDTRPATRMIGPADAEMWTTPAAGVDEFFEFRISSEMYIEQVHIYEMYIAGGVSEISLMTPTGTWYPVWTTMALEEINVGVVGRVMTPELMISHFKTSKIRIDIGARSQKPVIDAVLVFGKYQRLAKRMNAP